MQRIGEVGERRRMHFALLQLAAKRKEELRILFNEIIKLPFLKNN